MKQDMATMICVNDIEELTDDEKCIVYNILFDPYDSTEQFVHETAVLYCVGGIEEEEEEKFFYEKSEVAALEHLDNLLAAVGIERGHEVWLR